MPVACVSGLSPVLGLGLLCLADLHQLAVQTQAINRLDRESEKQRNAVLKVKKGHLEGVISTFLAGDGRRIRDAPVGGDGFTGPPNGTALLVGRVAQTEHEVHDRRTLPRELAPTFASGGFTGKPYLLQTVECEGMNLSSGAASCTEGAESPYAEVIQDGFGHDAAG